ncbi:MAG: hypothetical protein ACO3DP_01445 [Candidatus Nanopelagicaceae bacterium]
MKLLNKIKIWLFPTSVEGFKLDAIDRDGDGLVQEGTPFERKVTTVKKATAKKSPAKKTVKKSPVKKTTAKKTVKKSTTKKK